jgi:uncharacterized tellurite resistance protein B-like protein
MLDQLRALLTGSPPPPVAHWSRADVEVAAAALLIEAARVDGAVEPAEQALIVRLLEQRFGLDDAAAGELMALGARENDRTNELSRFANTINQRCSEAERIELIEMLWAVVYADGVLSAYEANLLRRIGGLLYVDDRDRGDARKRVLARLGRADPGDGR